MYKTAARSVCTLYILLKTCWIQVLTGVCSVITIYVNMKIVVQYLYVLMYKYFGTHKT
jgi:hypothetical protein